MDKPEFMSYLEIMQQYCEDYIVTNCVSCPYRRECVIILRDHIKTNCAPRWWCGDDMYDITELYYKED